MELTQLTAVPVIIALTQMIKQMGFPNRYLPVVNLVLGVVAAVILFHVSVLSITTGIVYGLTAAGLYRSIKVTGQGQ